jgi:hypothetical protein
VGRAAILALLSLLAREAGVGWLIDRRAQTVESPVGLLYRWECLPDGTPRWDFPSGVPGDVHTTVQRMCREDREGARGPPGH